MQVFILFVFQQWHIPRRINGIHPQRISDTVVQKPGTTSRGITSTLYNPIRQPLAEVNLIDSLRPQLLTLNPRPQIIDLWPDGEEEVTYTDSEFGLVPIGSVLSYQQKHKAVDDTDDVFVRCDTVTVPLPELPTIAPLNLSTSQLNFIASLQVSRDLSEQYRQDTRLQAKSPLWHALRKGRLTASNFKRITSRRGDFEKLAMELVKSKNIQTAAMKHGSLHEPVAAHTYATRYRHNTYLTGIVINPSAPHLACSPDRIVYDPDLGEFGLLEIKCPDKDSYLECSYLEHSDDNCTLKKSSLYYEQIIGQLGITGFLWCDFYVECRNDYHCERIFLDELYFANMQLKLDCFFYKYLLPEIVNSGVLSEL